MEKGRFTLSMIKPTALSNGKSGEIITMMNNAGFRIAALKLIVLRRNQAEAFYEVHHGKVFYEGLINFMVSGPIIVLVLEKDNAVEDYRKLMGTTDPEKAAEGTIRKLFGTNTQRNAVHGSDSDENAQREISFFFSRSEILNKEGYIIENFYK